MASPAHPAPSAHRRFPLSGRELKLLLTFWIIYLYFMNPLGTVMSNAALGETVSLVERHSFEINPQDAIDLSIYEGKVYSGIAPGTTFFAAPMYYITRPLYAHIPDFVNKNDIGAVMGFRTPDDVAYLQLFCSVFLVAFGSALMVMFFYRLLHDFSRNENYILMATITLGVGSLLFYYASAYYHQTLGAIFLFFCFYLLYRVKQRRLGSAYLAPAGLLAGLAPFTDYAQATVAFILFLYLLTFRRDASVLAFCLGAALPLGAIGLLDYIQFDNPLHTPYKYRWHQELAGHGYGFMGLTHPRWVTVYALSFHPIKGIFLYMPFVFLSLFGVFLKLRSQWRWEVLACLAIGVAYFFHNASLTTYTSWTSGQGFFGSRYFVVVAPFMAIPLVFALERVWYWFGLLICSASVFINYLGAQYGIYPFDWNTLSDRSVYPNKNPLWWIFKEFIDKGPGTPLFDTYVGRPPESLANNLAGLALLGVVILLVWNADRLVPRALRAAPAAAPG